MSTTVWLNTFFVCPYGRAKPKRPLRAKTMSEGWNLHRLNCASKTDVGTFSQFERSKPSSSSKFSVEAIGTPSAHGIGYRWLGLGSMMSATSPTGSTIQPLGTLPRGDDSNLLFW